MGDGVSVQTKRALLESGAMTPEDMGVVVRKPVDASTARYKSGSSAQQDAAAAQGLTVEQLRAKQDAQLQELLRKRKAQGYKRGGLTRYAAGGMIGINPRKPLELHVTPRDIAYGEQVDEIRRLADEQAYNDSRERMFAARDRENAVEAAKSRLPATVRLAQSQLFPARSYQELGASSIAPPYESFEDAVKSNSGLRLGIAQALSSPLMLTDIAEAGLDKLRGVHSPNRFRQASNLLSSAMGGDTEPEQRMEGPYDRAALGAALVNPGNFMPLGKLGGAVRAAFKPRGLARMLGGHSIDSILAEPAKLRQIVDLNDFWKQAGDLSAAQDTRGSALLNKGASIADLQSDFMHNFENGGKVYEVMPSAKNKRGWAMVAPKAKGEPTYISGIMAEEPGSQDFVNSTFNALLNDIDGPAKATAANGALAKYYKSKGIPVDDDWNMKFAGGGLIGGLGRLAKRLSADAEPVKRGVADVIKERGGQWLNGSVENVLAQELHNADNPRLQEALRQAGHIANQDVVDSYTALDNWVKGPLTKNIKRDMGTSNDPFVRLAEQGIQVTEAPYTHVANDRLLNKREKANFDRHGTAVSATGRAWENTNDSLIYVDKAGTYAKLPRSLERDPWLATVDPDTPVHSVNDSVLFEGGISHLLDELANAVHPESELPEHLRIRPEQLKSGNFSVEAAIRRVNDINKWRADATTEANQARANNAATTLHKDYPDKGFKWVELKAPENAEERANAFMERMGALTMAHPGDAKGTVPTAEIRAQVVKELGPHPLDALRDALNYEGDTMGHCVGGYCEDVASGRSRIYSLRDAKGEPHVTIEVQPHTGNVPITDEIRAGRSYLRPFDKFINFETGEASEHHIPAGLSIVQIKGKGNKKPIDDYLPFIQDFVKSGQWSDVGDLKNTDMWKHPKLGTYHTKAEAEADPALMDVYASRNLDDQGNYRGGYADGGLVDHNLLNLHGY